MKLGNYISAKLTSPPLAYQLQPKAHNLLDINNFCCFVSIHQNLWILNHSRYDRRTTICELQSFYTQT